MIDWNISPNRRWFGAILAGAMVIAGAAAPAAAQEPEEPAEPADVPPRLADPEQDPVLIAGWRDGFRLEDPQGNFLLRPNLQMQYRYILNHRTDGDDDTNSGFQMRRLKFGIEGHVFTSDLTYDFVWAARRDDGRPELENAYIQWRFEPQWALKAGQYKVPVHHEELTSSKRQLAVERSQVNELIGGRNTKYSQGVGIVYGASDNPLRVEAMFHDGPGMSNSDFDGTFDYGLAGRVSYVIFGNWGAYRDFTARATGEDTLIVGGGLDWSGLGAFRIFHYTADVHYNRTDGWSAFAALLGQSMRNGDSITNYGAVGQVGYLLTPNWEPFGRYSYTRLDSDAVPPGAERTLHELTAGVNYYFGSEGRYGHNAKLSIDGAWLPNGSPTNERGMGALAGEDDQFILRVQFQLLL